MLKSVANVVAKINICKPSVSLDFHKKHQSPVEMLGFAFLWGFVDNFVDNLLIKKPQNGAFSIYVGFNREVGHRSGSKLVRVIHNS